MTPLTAEEFIKALAGAPVTLSGSPPKDLLKDGDIFIWPSRISDTEETPGRHIEAVVFTGSQGNYVMVMVSPRIYEALGGTQ